MQIGLVGKPSAGKSTFFKAATLADVEIANYPFTTIDPNKGIGFVKVKDPARDFDKVSNPREGYVQNEFRFVPIQMIDVAGLVPGAHAGKGRGNQFLDDLNQADVLIHVVDVSGSNNENGEPVGIGNYDPCNDVEFLEVELDMWYLAILKKGWDKFARRVSQEKVEIAKALEKQMTGVKVTEDMVKSAIKELQLDENIKAWSEDNLKALATNLRMQTKPIIIAANKIDVSNGEENYKRLTEKFSHYTIIGCSAESELALKEAAKHKLIEYVPGEKTFVATGDLTDKQTQALTFIKTNVLEKHSTGVQDVLDTAVFNVLKYKAIFPGGVNKLEDSDGNCLPDCFLMPPAATALDFAYQLHTDFGKNFIKAIDVKTKKIVGKDHVLQHMDIIEIAAKH